MKKSTILKLCRRATKKNPKSVVIHKMKNTDFEMRYLKTTQRVWRVTYHKGLFCRLEPVIDLYY